MTVLVLAAVLFSVVAPLMAVASPFAPNATISVDDVLPVQNLVVPTGPSRPGELIGGGPNGTVSGVNCGDERPRVLINCTEEGPEICRPRSRRPSCALLATIHRFTKLRQGQTESRASVARKAALDVGSEHGEVVESFV